jgi:hypothetical protein
MSLHEQAARERARAGHVDREYAIYVGTSGAPHVRYVRAENQSAAMYFVGMAVVTGMVTTHPDWRTMFDDIKWSDVR